MERLKLIKASLLRATIAALAILSETYANTLFLSTYPKADIPYLYLSLAAFGFLAMQMSHSFVNWNLVKFTRLSHLLIIAVLVIFIFLVDTSIHWVPFVFAVFVITASSIATSISIIYVASMFSLREFKDHSRWLNFAPTVGILAIGFLTPLILKFFTSIYLLYVIIGLFALSLLINSLKGIKIEKPVESRRKHKPPKLLNDSLFMSTLISSILMLILFYFADFSLKSELTYHFTKSQIATFLVYFIAFINVITILSQIFIMPLILRRFGVVSLILTCPLLFIVASIEMFIRPGLWSAAFLAGVVSIARYSFYNVGYLMTLNVYAPAVRNTAQYQMQSYGRLGMGLAAILIIGLTWVENPHILAAGMILGAAAMIYISIRIGRAYFSTLKKAINLNRFHTDYLSTEQMDREIILDVASQALSLENEHANLFGLSLFRKSKLKKVPAFVIRAFSSEFINVRKAAIHVAKGSEDERVVVPLMQQLSREKNQEVSWSIVKAILHFSPNILLPFASSAIRDDHPAIRASAIRILLEAGDSQQQKQGEEAFLEMLNHADPTFRFWAANILKSGQVANSDASLHKLINDSNEEVARNALFAASAYPNEKNINLLIFKLENKSLAHAVGNSLVVIGPRAIPALLAHIHNLRNVRQINIELMLFTKFSAEEAEDALFEVLQEGKGLLLEICIVDLAYRAKQFSLSQKAQLIIYQYMLRELENIKILRVLSRSYQDVDILNEIHSRIYDARKRFLYLLASYSQTKTVLQIIPTLLKGDKGSRAYESAIELLELSMQGPILRNAISEALEDKKESLSLLESKIDPSFDSWLKQMIEYKQGIKQGDVMDDLIEKILVLRKVSLFSFLSAELVQSVAEIVQQEDIASGQIIFDEGEIADGMYIVVKGGVDIIKNKQTINFCGSGSFFGELALLDDAPRFASAVAKEDTQLFFIEKSDFNRLTDEVPEILKAVTQTIIGYLRNTQVV